MDVRVILAITLLVISVTYTIVNIANIYSEDEPEEDKPFQGPVRPTDDEAYFRKTGITKPLEEDS